MLEVQFKGMFMAHEYAFSLENETGVSLHVRDSVVLDTDFMTRQ